MRLAWVAGLIEGEGCIGVRGGRPHVTVDSTDEDVIQRLLDWTGVGHKAGPRQGTNKLVWRWRISKRDDAGQLLENVLPLLCDRRAQKAREVIAEWKAAGPTRGTSPTCGKGHLLDESNLRLADGRRRCRKCDTARMQEYRARVRDGHGNE